MKKYFYFLLLACLFFTNMLFAQKVPSAETLLNNAYKKATKENKKVFVIFHASWCGWCKKLDASMNDKKVKPFFDSNYVIVHLTVMESREKRKLENKGAIDSLLNYSGPDPGLPFFVIQDNTGKILETSNNNDEGNIGCPAKKDEVDYFISMFTKTSSINEFTKKKIFKQFIKNGE